MIAEKASYAERLGIQPDFIVQELGWDEDALEDLRIDLRKVLAEDLVDEDFREVVDAVLYWWREGDGDLADALMDATTMLDEDGFIWVLSPKKGEIGYVDASEIAEAASIAGLSQTLTENFDSWLASKLDQRKNKK